MTTITMPFTNHERSLIDQIQTEIGEMNAIFQDCIAAAEKETNADKQNEHIRRAWAMSKQIRERSKTRESLVRDVFNRLTNPKGI